MRRRISADRQLIINTLAVLLIICLFAYMLVQLSQNVSENLSTQRTQVITDETYVSFKGYIFRDERIVDEGEVIADYLFPDGEKLSVGTAFAEIYPSADGLSDEERAVGQGQINALLSQIELLENSVSGSHRVADIKDVNEAIDRAYGQFIESVALQSFAAADISGELLLGGINDRLVMTGRLEETDRIITELERQKQELLRVLASGEKQSVVTDESCYFYRELDGYEKVFDYGKVMSMTAAEFSAMLSADRENLSAIGKKLLDTKWYATAIVDASLCEMLEVGESRDIIFTDNNSKVISMTVERIVPCDNGEGMVVFSSRELPRDFDFARAQSMRLLTDTVSGYRVPTEAVTVLDGERGVYILSGNIVEFRRVTLIGQGNGYYIANTYDNDSAEDNLSEIPYLNVNDLIITSGGDLYDGKILK